MLTVLLALTVMISVPSAFAEVVPGNYGFTQMKNANIAFNTALDQFLLKIMEIVEHVNQNEADIQQVNGTIFDGPYSLESLIGNNMMNISDNTEAITELQNNPPVSEDKFIVQSNQIGMNLVGTGNQVNTLGSINKPVFPSTVDVNFALSSIRNDLVSSPVTYDTSNPVLPIGNTLVITTIFLDPGNASTTHGTCTVNGGESLSVCDIEDLELPSYNFLRFELDVSKRADTTFVSQQATIGAYATGIANIP